jgi:cephalosporin-C deacetylase-like acetyl esterase
MHYRRILLISLQSCLLFLATAYAQEPKPEYRLTVRAERTEPIYDKGEKIEFRVQLFEKDQPLAGQHIQFVILGDGNYEKKGSVVSTDSFASIEVSRDRPGFLKCSVDWTDGTHKASGIAGAGIAPLEIKSVQPEPTDFDEFWDKRKAEVLQLPLEVNMEKIDPGSRAVPGVDVFDVKVNCIGGAPLSGYFAKPADAKPKSLPIVVSFHGAGVYSAGMPISTAAKGALAFDVNAHGLDNGKPAEYYAELYKGPLKNYFYENTNDPNRRYFIGLFQRALRSLQFMKSQPEWDGKTLVVTGSSKGGAQAIVAAGLDPDVTFCLAFVPALSYIAGYLDGDFGGWPGFMKDKRTVDADPEIVAAMPYLDTAIHAKRSKAESVLTVGFVDYTCSPTSVYVAFNNISAPKRIFNMPEEGHNTSPSAASAAYQLLWEHIEKRR